jgi:hypothetical protein
MAQARTYRTNVPLVETMMLAIVVLLLLSIHTERERERERCTAAD